MTTPPYPPYPPEPEPEPERWQPPGGNRTGTIVGFTFLGIAVFVGLNLAVALVALLVTGTAGSNPDLAFQIAAGALILITFGGGLALLLARRGWTIGMGLGLMIGWALTSVVTAGYCTGINPGLYA